MHSRPLHLALARISFWKAFGPAAIAGLAMGLAGCAPSPPREPAKAASAPLAPAHTPATPNPPVRTSKPDDGPSAKPGAWQSLFDGQTLKGWAVSDFAGRGDVRVEGGKLILGLGVMTGVTWTSDIPKMNYEVTLDAMRVEGSDFFCALTFPVGEAPCSFIVGGWGGGTVGLSSLDGDDAANNETTKYLNFENGKWFAIRLRVTPGKIEAWIDEDTMVDVVTTGRKIDIRLEVEPSRPFGLASWSTKAALRNIRIRRL